MKVVVGLIGILIEEALQGRVVRLLRGSAWAQIFPVSRPRPLTMTILLTRNIPPFSTQVLALLQATDECSVDIDPANVLQRRQGTHPVRSR